VKKTKIIHVVKGRADPNTLNGVNKWIHNVSTVQKKRGIDVEVWGITNKINNNKHNHIYKLNLLKQNQVLNFLDKKIINNKQYLKKKIIFHFHSVFIYDFYKISKKIQNFGIKWILSPHGGYASSKNFILKYFYKKIFENKLIEGASLIHAIAKSDIINSTKTKYGIAHNGVAYKNKYKKNYSYSSRLRINYCGRINIKQKGLDILIASLHSLKQNGIKVKLDIIGDGNDKKELKNIVNNLNLGNNVKFYGVKFNKEKDDIIKKSDVFIHCSRWEGMPLSVLESAMLAMPLIVSKQTNLAKYVKNGKAGYIINNLTVSELNKKIKTILKDKINKKLIYKGVSARKMALKYFSWENTVSLLNKNIYSKIYK
tara:strand:- start:1678 stop:2787 length:1110 start_codon:yes stop_codon:yes gene_type:complete